MKKTTEEILEQIKKDREELEKMWIEVYGEWLKSFIIWEDWLATYLYDERLPERYKHIVIS